MSTKQLLANSASYNLNANQQFVNWLQTKPEEQLLQHVPSSFAGILQTFNHIWAVEEMWCASLFKNTDAINRYSAEAFNSKEIFDGLIHRSTQIESYVNALTEEAFAETVDIKTPWFEANLPLCEYLQHLFNHSTYHRGQLITQAHALGFTGMPSTDFLFYRILTTQNH